MLRRIRTTKKLARRIDLQYFKHSHPLRRWRFWLSVVVPVVALGSLLAQRAQGGQKAYSSGPLSASHAVFTQQCSLCHVARAGAFFKEVSDNACLACHEGPVHHANQAFTPSCSSCHIEHKGSARLAATSTASCIHATQPFNPGRSATLRRCDLRFRSHSPRILSDGEAHEGPRPGAPQSLPAHEAGARRPEQPASSNGLRGLPSLDRSPGSLSVCE